MSLDDVAKLEERLNSNIGCFEMQVLPALVLEQVVKQ